MKSWTIKGVPLKNRVYMKHREEISLFPYTLPMAIKMPPRSPSGAEIIINLRVTPNPSSKAGESISKKNCMVFNLQLPSFHRVHLFYK